MNALRRHHRERIIRKRMEVARRTCMADADRPGFYDKNRPFSFRRWFLLDWEVGAVGGFKEWRRLQRRRRNAGLPEFKEGG